MASVPVGYGQAQAWRRCYDRRAAMPFIPPMLATRLEDPRRLADPRYSAEPKLDGQRAQVYGSGSVLFVPDSLASSTLRPDNEIRCTSHIKAPPPVRSSPAAER